MIVVSVSARSWPELFRLFENQALQLSYSPLHHSTLVFHTYLLLTISD